jgi:hypothetical protein
MSESDDDNKDFYVLDEPPHTYQVGDLVRLSSHLFPPETGSTSYYSIVPMKENVFGVIIAIKEPLKSLNSWSRSRVQSSYDGYVPPSYITQYYEIIWLDVMGATTEKHYDLELVSAAITGSKQID